MEFEEEFPSLKGKLVKPEFVEDARRFFIDKQRIKKAINKVIDMGPAGPADGGRSKESSYADGWCVALSELKKELGL